MLLLKLSFRYGRVAWLLGHGYLVHSYLVHSYLVHSYLVHSYLVHSYLVVVTWSWLLGYGHLVTRLHRHHFIDTTLLRSYSTKKLQCNADDPWLNRKYKHK